MRKLISIAGIETNNLKNISVFLRKNYVNIIIGPSGSGKSSLAYDTVAQIGLYEFNSMFDDVQFEPNFRVRSYSNMVATVPIRQNNINNNIRSTIGTYFNINSHVALLYSVLLSTPYDFFVLNREDNLCPICHGIGYLKELDVNRIIDYSLPLEKCPIKCWVRHKDFYIGIIKEFCNDLKIDSKKSFKELNSSEKNLILYGESDKKYSIKFKKHNGYSRRTTKYFGIMTETPMLPKYFPGKNFYADKVCPACHGEKYSLEHRKVKLNGLSIGELMCISFSDMGNWIKSVKNLDGARSLEFSLKQISNFANTATLLKLGYLNFNRTIPSLSGGELQRVKLVQVFNTQLTDLLIILDEPLAGLSNEEKDIIYQNIQKLSKNHTVLIIDHHNTCYDDIGKIIALGKGSGKYGGSLVDAREYLKTQAISFDFHPKRIDKLVEIKSSNQVYSYSGINIEIAKNRLNLIFGRSGIGKSTLLREYLPQFYDRYTYINQKPLVGNSNSNVATVLNIFNDIAGLFAEKYKKNKLFFSNHTGCEGACPYCLGAGKVAYGSESKDIYHVECKECNGTGFSKKLVSFKISGYSIVDIWKMTIDEALPLLSVNSKMLKVLSKAQEVLLGHLLIGQQTSSLSGGENVRIKILKNLGTSSLVYGVDEPFRGLNNFEIHKIGIFLDKFIEDNKTIIVADHEEKSFKYFSCRIELKNIDGILTGEK